MLQWPGDGQGKGADDTKMGMMEVFLLIVYWARCWSDEC